MFSGYQWVVRATGEGGPGPNTWDDANARVDDLGQLHLQITNNRVLEGYTEWRCVELSTVQRLGFGRYQFQVIGRIDNLDRNVVLGLFKYPTPDVGLDGTNEIDIEFAQWGRTTANNADYVVYPASGPRAPNDTLDFQVLLQGDFTTHRFLWDSRQVTFQSLYGHRDNDIGEFQRWQYTPNEGRLIPQQPTPVHINLWLFRGHPPYNSREVDIVISQFAFIPLA
jgi:hypothetical protein